MSKEPLTLEPSYSNLFQPGQIGTMKLRNRMVQSPIFTQFAGTYGDISDRLLEYHRARARGGAGLIITENTSVDWQLGRTVGHPMRIDEDRFRSGLMALTEAVHNEGAKIAVQLHHTGRQNSKSNTEGNVPPLAPTGGITSAFGTEPRTIEADEIPGLIDFYVQGARRAKESGFDAVELHGAHGYLLGQFLSPKTNKRTDEWGGSLENRARFALAVVQGIRDIVGPDYPVMYRMSVEEPYEGGLPLEDGLAFAKMLEPLVDAIDVSAGNYDTADTLLPMYPPGNLVHYAKAVKQVVNVPIIAVGRLTWLLQEMDEAVGNGDFDFVALGRAQLADAEGINKTRRGEHAHVRRCIAVNECISRWMFNGQRTQCVINPALSQEQRSQQALHTADKKKKVLIVGAGPSGCEAAMKAAERGHEVTLVERENSIGGQMRAWAAASYLRMEIEHMINFYRVELERLNVEVQLNTDATDLDLAAFDEVLLATGTNAGERPEGTIDAVTMLISGEKPDADAVTVFGETEVAMFSALWLAEQGIAVTLSSPADNVGLDTNDMQRDRLLQLLNPAGVEIKTNQAAPSGGVIVWAQDRVADQTLEDAVNLDNIRTIGTRFRGGRMFEATQSGYWTASEI
ncbi:FAD-dependent oxidoreductase [Corynebacterium callunae]|uniref:oxidoreductase n=1 Tax=Corynebacterium callunae TaxID=1721 RepID=UPI00398223BE